MQLFLCLFARIFINIINIVIIIVFVLLFLLAQAANYYKYKMRYKFIPSQYTIMLPWTFVVEVVPQVGLYIELNGCWMDVLIIKYNFNHHPFTHPCTLYNRQIPNYNEFLCRSLTPQRQRHPVILKSNSETVSRFIYSVRVVFLGICLTGEGIFSGVLP